MNILTNNTNNSNGTLIVNNAGQINASNLNINAGYNESGNLSTNGTQNNIYIKGSDLHILGTTTFKAYGDVGIFSAQDYSKHIFYSEAVEKDLGAIIGGTIVAGLGAVAAGMLTGGAGTLAVGASAVGGLIAGFEQENSTKITDIHENTTQVASNVNTANLNIISAGDTTIKASNVGVLDDANISVGTITDGNNNETKIDNAAKFSVLSDFNIAKNIFKKEEHKVELGSFLAMQFAIGLVSEFAGGMAASYIGKAAENTFIAMALENLPKGTTLGRASIWTLEAMEHLPEFAAKFPIKSGLESLSLSAMEVSGINETHLDGASITENKTEVKSNFNYNNLVVK
jgi:hypothetical protein